MRLTLRLGLFVSSGLFVSNGLFVSCDYVKERKECLRLDECGLKGMSSELKES